MIPSKIIRLAEVDSTNRYAKSICSTGQEISFHGSVIISENQTGGKGRLGRTWQAEPGANLTFSVILKPISPPATFGLVPLIAGSAVVETLGRFQITGSAKWPNDVLVGGKKICGVLCELVSAADGSPAIVMGIGLNVNQERFPEELQPTATSMSLAVGKKFDRDAVLESLLAALDSSYGEYERGDYRAVRERWKRNSGMLGRTIAVDSGSERISGTAADIADDGALVIETALGPRSVYAGDVTVLKGP